MGTSLWTDRQTDTTENITFTTTPCLPDLTEMFAVKTWPVTITYERVKVNTSESCFTWKVANYDELSYICLKWSPFSSAYISYNCVYLWNFIVLTDTSAAIVSKYISRYGTGTLVTSFSINATLAAVCNSTFINIWKYSINKCWKSHLF